MAYHTKLPIVTDGLVLYYDAANTKSYVSGDTQMNNLVKDSPFQGTITNGATFDDTNKGILLDGSNQDIELTNPTSFNYGNEITVIVGCTPNSLTPASLFAPGGNDSDNFLRMSTDGVNPETKFRFTTTQAGGNLNALQNYSTTEVVTGTSYFVGGIVDGFSTRLYVNGKKESDLTSGVARALWDTTVSIVHQGGKVNIGSRPFTSDQLFLDGLIHYVLFYNRVLTDAEMYQNYSSLRGRFI